MNTRSACEVWLIGKAEAELVGSGLPTVGTTLRHLFFHHLECKKTLKESLKLTIRALLPIWNKARIPTRRSDKCEEMLEKLYAMHRSLKKNRLRKSNAEETKQAMFKSDLDELFDVSHQDALMMMTNEEDKTFLVMQREDTKSCSMGGVDKVLDGCEARKRQRMLREVAWKEKHEQTSTAPVTSIDAPTHDDEEDDPNDPDYQQPSTSSTPPSKRSRQHNQVVITPSVAAAMDRAKLSDRAATFVAASIVQSVGKDLDSVVLSRNSIRRARMNTRQETAADVKKVFSSDKPLLLHWDTKLLPDIAGGTHLVDRIAMLVSGGGEEQLLAVPKIDRGTGENQAMECITKLDEWGLKNLVRGIVFDTTAANTGLSRGACTFIEKALEKDIIWIACRHHVFELVLSSVFSRVMGASDGPNVALFKRFQKDWDRIDKAIFSPASDDMFTGPLADMRKEAKRLYLEAIEEHHVRDDYRELLLLSLAFLSGESYDLAFRAPGAVHNARWMAKAIYCLKIYLLRDQFRLTAREEKAVTRIAVFVSVVYVRFWHEAPLPERAPVNDSRFLQLIDVYPDTDIRDAANRALRRHLWFHSEQLITLALFDDRVTADTKSRMVANLDRLPAEKSLVRLEGSTFDHGAPLESFVTSRSLRLFDLLSLNGKDEARRTFLKKDPTMWPTDSTYLNFKENVRVMKVVNDTAERGIALIKEFNGRITQNEEELQHLLLLVAKHRKELPVPTKGALKL